ncbi:MAG: hypothetical protein HFJ24_05675 [Clostridia bacterium]|nr:hypothetical protein [Clostridia bacterium]MCI9275444.1 hypothetical protein [Clostridia bacterium]
MIKIRDLYAKFELDNNITYSIDKLRLKTYMTYEKYNAIDFYFRTYYKDKIKKFWISDRPQCFHYNWNIEIEEGISFYFGFCHNTEQKISERFEPEYNFTIDFNPNKLKQDNLLMYLLGQVGKWYIVRYDLAMDLKVSILDLIIDKSGKRKMQVFSNGFDDKTYTLGKSGAGHIKIYNKKKESNINMTGDLTRVELTIDVNDFYVGAMLSYNYILSFPDIYLNSYVYSLSDYQSKDRTVYALLYAVQNGYPINDLSRVYKKKIKDMLQGGYQIRFSSVAANKILKQVIYYYFINNPLVIWSAMC